MGLRLRDASALKIEHLKSTIRIQTNDCETLGKLIVRAVSALSENCRSKLESQLFDLQCVAGRLKPDSKVQI